MAKLKPRKQPARTKSVSTRRSLPLQKRFMAVFAIFAAAAGAYYLFVARAEIDTSGQHFGIIDSLNCPAGSMRSAGSFGVDVNSMLPTTPESALNTLIGTKLLPNLSLPDFSLSRAGISDMEYSDTNKQVILKVKQFGPDKWAVTEVYRCHA